MSDEAFVGPAADSPAGPLFDPVGDATGDAVHDPVADPVDGATVDAAVLALRPDYRALLLLVEGVRGGPPDPRSERLLREAEQSSAGIDVSGEPDPQVGAWQEAYRSFGAKPSRTRSSLDALRRRAAAGLPRVDRITDTYNALSVLRGFPIGGEDADRYEGPPRLVRAIGDEIFDTMADGAPAVEHPEPGEVVWRDDAGVTCRRWNWRQGVRTRLVGATTRALFIVDALDPATDDDLHALADELVSELALDVTPLVSRRRVLSAADPGRG